MAGLAIIASNCSYNKEIIREDKNEGIILKENFSYEMEKYIHQLYNMPEKLYDIKKASYASRKRYSLEEYLYLFKNFY